jgi:DNA-directed RNA polymerase alpha subunit
LEEKNNLVDLVLETLSFLEPMTFSQIILDFNSEQLLKFPNFSKEDLEEVIKKLEKKKLLKRVVIDKEVGWIKIQRKRSWFQKLLYYLK